MYTNLLTHQYNIHPQKIPVHNTVEIYTLTIQLHESRTHFKRQNTKVLMYIIQPGKRF